MCWLKTTGGEEWGKQPVHSFPLTSLLHPLSCLFPFPCTSREFAARSCWQDLAVKGGPSWRMVSSLDSLLCALIELVASSSLDRTSDHSLAFSRSSSLFGFLPCCKELWGLKSKPRQTWVRKGYGEDDDIVLSLMAWQLEPELNKKSLFSHTCLIQSGGHWDHRGPKFWAPGASSASFQAAKGLFRQDAENEGPFR